MRDRKYIKVRNIIILIFLNLACLFFNGCGKQIDAREDAVKCPIHGDNLKEDTVSVRYGLPVFTDEYTKAKNELFPYANSYCLGGCVVQPEKRALVKYCPKCRKAEKEWNKVRVE